MMLWKRLYKDNIWAENPDQLQGFCRLLLCLSLLRWFCVVSAMLIHSHSYRPEQRFQEND